MKREAFGAEQPGSSYEPFYGSSGVCKGNDNSRRSFVGDIELGGMTKEEAGQRFRIM